MANGSDLPMPMQKDERGETFQALADQFQLNMETMDYIKNCKIETLHDPRFFFAMRVKWQPSSTKHKAFQMSR